MDIPIDLEVESTNTACTSIKIMIKCVKGFPAGASVKNPPANAGDLICGFEPWITWIPWRMAWQPHLVFLPGEFHGQRSLKGYIQSIESQRVGHDWNDLVHAQGMQSRVFPNSQWTMGRIHFKRKGRLSDLPNFELQPKSLTQDLKPVSCFFNFYETVLSLLWKSEVTKGFEKDVKGVLSSHGKKCTYQNANAEKEKKPLKSNQSFFLKMS